MRLPICKLESFDHKLENYKKLKAEKPFLNENIRFQSKN